MNQRGIVSDKQQLLTILEDTYKKAVSETDFYRRLGNNGIEVYIRYQKETGIILKRKYRFKTLGYDKNVLKELDKNLTRNKRLKNLKRIRKHQNEQLKKLDRNKIR